MNNPPRALVRAIQQALHVPHRLKQHTRHDARHDGLTPDPALGPPLVPAMGAHGGLNKYDLLAGDIPVLSSIYNFAATGDIVMLYVDNIYVDYGTVGANPFQPLVFNVPSLFFTLTPGNPHLADVHFHVKDEFDNEASSQSQIVPVKTTVPGDPPGDPTDPTVNPRLADPAGVPLVINNPATAPAVVVSVAAYTNMAVGDKITLYWAGEPIAVPPLTIGEVGNAVSIPVPLDIIQRFPGNNLPVRYSIRDVVNNYSLYSPSVLTSVRAAGTLNEPLVRGTNAGELDVDLLNGADVEVMVSRHPEIGANDDVTLWWTGRSVDGNVVEYSVGPLQIGAQIYITFMVRNEYAAELIDGSAYVFYEVQPAAGGALKTSYGSSFTVKGSRITLQAPLVPSATGGILNADAIPTGGTVAVTVPANTMLVTGSTVTLIWSGAGPTGNVYYEESRTLTTDGGPVEFLVPRDQAAQLIGGTLEVYYNVQLPGNVTHPSPRLSLTVSGAATALPAPTFDPPLTGNNVLDPDSLATGGINVLVNVPSTLYVGGKARVYWSGTGATKPVMELPIAALGELRFWVERAAYVDPNLNTTVDVYYELIPATGAPGVSLHALVTVSNVNSRPWPAPGLWDASGQEVYPFVPARETSTGVWEANTGTLGLTDNRLRAGDEVTFAWTLADGTELTIPVATAEDGRAVVSVPAEVLAASVGKAVSVTYVAVIGGVPGTISEVLHLQVADFPGGALPAPVVVEVPGDVLDMNVIADGITVWVKKYPLMAVGQTYWLTARGILEDGTPGDVRLGTAPYQVTAADLADGFRAPLDRESLLQLADGSTLTIELKVGFVNSNEGEAIMFARRELSVVQEVRADLPVVESDAIDAEQVLDLKKINEDYVLFTAAYTLTAGQSAELIWQAPPGAVPVIVPAQTAPLNGKVAFRLPKSDAEDAVDMPVAVAFRVAQVSGGSTTSSLMRAVDVRGTRKPYFEDFEEYAEMDLPEGTKLKYFSILGSYSSRIVRAPESSVVSGKALFVPAGTMMYIDLYQEMNKVQFVCSGSSLFVVYFSATDEVLGEFYISGNGHTSPDFGVRIKKLRLVANNTSHSGYFDSFQFTD